MINAFARRAGQTITKDTAIGILNDLFPNRAWAPAMFGSAEFQGYRIQCERMCDVLPELDGMHAAHYGETEKYRAGLPMNPDYEAMQESERAGGLIQFTARHIATGELVGNMRVYISTSQRLYSLLKGTELDERDEKEDPAEKAWKPQESIVVFYNQNSLRSLLNHSLLAKYFTVNHTKTKLYE
ncbi:MAG: hypothetical protein EON58_11680 [Alphaproteobacteria bacterium]|nr:MAG: hypothetical protein EON58_11680 [Alphaproteobacteria bacterium]